MSHDLEELAMQSISIIGLDIGKSVFQVHDVDDVGQVTALHCRRCRVLEFQPVAGATGAVARAQPLRHDAFQP